MAKSKRRGWLVAGVLLLVFLGTVFCILPSIDQPGLYTLRNRGRGVWVAVTSANSDREARGEKAIWPKEQGFDCARTSTEYFRQLMSDKVGVVASRAQDQTVFDLQPEYIGGEGVPVADSVAAFTNENNAWIVVCVGSDTSSDTPFLISRNVYLGNKASFTSAVSLVKSPFTSLGNYVVWVTRGGQVFKARPKYATGAQLFPNTNEIYDVMYP